MIYQSSIIILEGAFLQEYWNKNAPPERSFVVVCNLLLEVSMEINSLWFSNLHWDLKVIILNSVSSLQSLWTKINELVKAFYNEIKSFLKKNSNFLIGMKHGLKTAEKVFLQNIPNILVNLPDLPNKFWVFSVFLVALLG